MKQYIQVDKLVNFIKQNGFVYANSLNDMVTDGVVPRSEYERVVQEREVAINYLNNLRLETGHTCYGCKNDKFDYDKSTCLGCGYNDDMNWEFVGSPDVNGLELCSHPKNPCLYKVFDDQKEYCSNIITCLYQEEE